MASFHAALCPSLELKIKCGYLWCQVTDPCASEQIRFSALLGILHIPWKMQNSSVYFDSSWGAKDEYR